MKKEYGLKHFLIRALYNPITAFFIFLFVVYVFIIKQNVQTSPEVIKSTDKVACERTNLYNMPPEFSRALSLIMQRYSQRSDPYLETYKKMINCVDVEYTDIHSSQAQTEGYFIFDEDNSSLGKLNIYVDESYANYDDLTTSFLIVHELTHARQYVEEQLYGKKVSCVNKEVYAFRQQLYFETYLNKEEQNSLVARAEKAENQNPQLYALVTLLDLSWEAIQETTRGRTNTTQAEAKQYLNVLTNKIKIMIEANPTYQKQCDL